MKLKTLAIIILIPLYSFGMVERTSKIEAYDKLEPRFFNPMSEAITCNHLYYYILDKYYISDNIEISPSVEASLIYLYNRITFLEMQDYNRRVVEYNRRVKPFEKIK